MTTAEKRQAARGGPPGRKRTIPFDWKWGLMRGEDDGSPPSARQVLRHWFVRYNPLYFLARFACLQAFFLWPAAQAISNPRGCSKFPYSCSA